MKKNHVNWGRSSPLERILSAFLIRVKDAASYLIIPPKPHRCNGDEQRYPSKIGNYSKGLPHNELGEVELFAYQAFLTALNTGKPSDFEQIPLGGAVKLTDPQSAYAYELAGPDSHQITLEAPPSFSSAREASEMAELYWRALARDVPFAEYDTNPITQEAAADLSTYSDFGGPKVNGRVTTDTLFRGDKSGDVLGPFLSQFMWKDVPYGADTVVQQYRTTVPKDDHLTDYKEWLKIQNGMLPSTSNVFDTAKRYIRDGRGLSEYVHEDFPYMAVLNACLILLSYGPDALDQNNPYLQSLTQTGFSTFGAPHILDFTARAARAALEAAWFQKFLVHRRLRPEEFGGRVHNTKIGAAQYPIHEDLLSSRVLTEIDKQYGSFLLPVAYAEGCATHPAFPGGHASFASAGVTMLKAFFNESFVIPNPVQASADGLSLIPRGSLLNNW
ncbi:phosphoesterase [Heyndrickxia acidicola]|uniref:Phosphoesterase n=1 Tax=Heyndrickxia acidicola TaxID=209389 RepID=A0ABU6MHH7_9BACI|nr:phosphoesterase [Heyndrickxia acidicola]MED1204131.1 phosphoesterase [Heyndrickxia acidicola]